MNPAKKNINEAKPINKNTGVDEKQRVNKNEDKDKKPAQKPAQKPVRKAIPLKVQLTELTKKITQFTNDNLKLKEANLDLLVEMELLRKRTEREIEKIKNFASEKLIKELLPFLDSLELGAKQTNATVSNLTKGTQMSLDMLIKVLEKNEVSFINPKINSELNPSLHEAITIIASDTIKNNHILDVMQKGVALNGRVIRSAKVIVAENSSDSQEIKNNF